MDILTEFEMKKKSNGDEKETERICMEIAKRRGLDPEEVIDYVYMHRYEFN